MMKTLRRVGLDEALRMAVDALGGLQEVGSILRPDVDPILSGQWLSHCLTASKRDKLSTSQIDLIFDRAAEAGEHEGIKHWARSRGGGYHATPIAAGNVLAEASQRAIELQKAADAARHDLNSLIDNPRLLAQMQHAGLKVGEIA